MSILLKLINIGLILLMIGTAYMMLPTYDENSLIVATIIIILGTFLLLGVALKEIEMK